MAELHKLKTALFVELVERGELPLRPGVARLVAEAREAGVKARRAAPKLKPLRSAELRCALAQIAVCSTSNEASVSGIVRVGLGADVAKVMRVFAGDVVPRKKPDPAIYLLAAKELGVEPGRCVVVEDSHIGVRAAKAAGMRCMVTTSGCARASWPNVTTSAAAETSTELFIAAQVHGRRRLLPGGRGIRLHRRQGCVAALASCRVVVLMRACSIQVRSDSRCTT